VALARRMFADQSHSIPEICIATSKKPNHPRNYQSFAHRMADGQIGGLLLACSAQRAHSQEKLPAQYVKQAVSPESGHEAFKVRIYNLLPSCAVSYFFIL